MHYLYGEISKPVGIISDSNQIDLKRKARRANIYHIYFRRSGLYRFVVKNLLATIVVFALLYFLFAFIQRYIIDLGMVFENLVEDFRTGWVLVTFFASESLLGLLPPDFFIIWAKDFEKPYLMVTILAILSYAGGIVSYWIGRSLSYKEAVSSFIAKHYKKNFIFVKKWGGFFVVLAALLPLPFAAVSVLTGMLRFPHTLFVILSTTRFLRFYFHAWLLFKMIS